jgi:pimeloyl-ACP methyl ester carboxylesterase
MELRQLRHFLALVEERSITRAANRELIVQSGLSNSLQALERELGTPLYVRGTRPVRRTAAGDALVGPARRTLTSAAQAEQAVHQRPLTGYDTATMAGDVAELATHLGFDQFRVAGEDWGAAIAYAVAAFHRPLVQQLVFQETLLPGLPAGPGLPGGEHDSSLAADDMRTGWHFSFLSLPNVPELLLAGRERPFWTWYARRQMWDPSALAEEDIDEMVHSAEQPGGTRAISEMYRARQTDAEQNRPHYADPISCPVLAVGAQAYLGDEVSKQLAQVARDVRGAVIPASGHNIALENPAALAQAYLDFFAGG